DADLRARQSVFRGRPTISFDAGFGRQPTSLRRQAFALPRARDDEHDLACVGWWWWQREKTFEERVGRKLRCDGHSGARTSASVSRRGWRRRGASFGEAAPVKSSRGDGRRRVAQARAAAAAEDDGAPPHHWRRCLRRTRKG